MISTPFGLVETPSQVGGKYFFCLSCNEDVNVGDCSHNKQDFVPPLWIKEYNLWRCGKLEISGETLQRFTWLRDNSLVFFDGFESNNYSAWTNTVIAGASTISTVSDQAKQGAYSSLSSRPSGTGAAYCYRTLDSAVNILYVRMYVRWDVIPGNNENHVAVNIFYNGEAGTTMFRLGWVNNSGTMNWWVAYRSAGGSTTVNITPTTSPVVNTWFCMEGKIDCSTSDGTTDGSYQLWVNGNSEWSIANIDTDNTTVNNIRCGMTGAGVIIGLNVWVDSVIMDDASYIGPIQNYAFIL